MDNLLLFVFIVLADCGAVHAAGCMQFHAMWLIPTHIHRPR